jgi:protein TonB
MAKAATAKSEPAPVAAEPRIAPEAARQAEPEHPPAVDVAGLKVLIQHAVQEAAVYPPRARLLHRQGRAQVRFDYAGGAVAGVALAQSSQSPMLDEAALEAVRRATYPKAAAQLRLALVVWVNFVQAAD